MDICVGHISKEKDREIVQRGRRRERKEAWTCEQYFSVWSTGYIFSTLPLFFLLFKKGLEHIIEAISTVILGA